MSFAPFRRLAFLILALVLATGLRAQYDATTIRAYIDAWWPVAVAQMEQHGVPASISLAQGILESGAGTSELTRRANNHFGIKCHKEWTGKSVRYDDDAKNECFRHYRDARESWEDHSNFLVTRSRYASLFTLKPTDYEGWAKGLRKAGYATNPRYADLLIKLIRDYDLAQYDRMDVREVPLAKRGGPKAPSLESRPSAEQASDAIVWFNRVPSVLARQGDRPADVAARHDLKLTVFCAYNDMKPTDVLAEGERVFLKPKRNKASSKRHRVQTGETLRSISQQYAVRLDKLAERNGVSSTFIPAPGEWIELRGKAKTTPRSASSEERRLAENRNTEAVPSTRSRTTTPIASRSTQPEAKSDPEPVDFVPVSGTPKPAAPVATSTSAANAPASTSIEAPAAAATPSAKRHTVATGDTLYNISRRYGVTVEAIREWNGLSDNGIKLGQELVVGQ